MHVYIYSTYINIYIHICHKYIYIYLYVYIYCVFWKKMKLFIYFVFSQSFATCVCVVSLNSSSVVPSSRFRGRDRSLTGVDIQSRIKLGFSLKRKPGKTQYCCSNEQSITFGQLIRVELTLMWTETFIWLFV